MLFFTQPDQVESPKGFRTAVANIGIKDNTEDFVCIYSERKCSLAAVFTQSRFAGASVRISRTNAAKGVAQAVVVISKNANVATGHAGEQNAQDVLRGVAHSLGVSQDDVLIASTGVIGRPYPMDRIMPFVEKINERMGPADIAAAARGIMTTDTVAKQASARVGGAVVAGIAKGVGMIEPNMATLLTFFLTDADIPTQDLDAIFRRVVNKTFNCLSIDTDTSTSDTAMILANGTAGPVDKVEFEAAVEKIARHLVMSIARDGEGATKLLQVTVEGAKDDIQAKRVAKSIVNSPLVKTAVHGADPNWGRVAMAIGKCEQDRDILPERTCIKFGDMEVYPRRLYAVELERLTKELQREEVYINVNLSIATGSATVWGCDLSAEYVKINGEYTT
jgi:glutamate N-acetyltransferase / amino-acid N-acetyltransferase